MDHSELTQHVRQIASDALAEIHGCAAEPRETLLLCNGLYCGRGFEVEATQAVWMVEEDRLTVVDAAGEVVQAWDNISKSVVVARKAA